MKHSGTPSYRPDICTCAPNVLCQNCRAHAARPRRNGGRQVRRWTKEQIRLRIRQWVTIHRRLPLWDDFRAAKGLPSGSGILAVYGSVTAARIDAGFASEERARVYAITWTKERVTLAFRRFVDVHSHPPVYRNLDARYGLPAPSTVIKLFGSVAGAREAAGLESGRRSPMVGTGKER